MKIANKFDQLFSNLIFVWIFWRSLFFKSDNAKPLVVAFSGLGDLLLATPLLSSIANDRTSCIDVLATKELSAVLKGNPVINKVYEIKKDEKLSSSLLKTLNSNGYTTIYSIRSTFPILLQFALFGKYKCWERHPVYEKILGRFFYRFKFFRKHYFSKQHMVMHMFKMNKLQSKLLQIRQPSFFSSYDANKKVVAFLQEKNIQNFVCVNVSGSEKAKRLVPNTLVTLSNLLPCRLLLIGYGDSDKNLAKEVLSKTENAVDCIGLFSIEESFELIKHASAVVAPDSFVMHLVASCSATPLVALVGYARPTFFGPWGRKENIIVLDRNPPCSPCRKSECAVFNGVSCVQDIRAEEILEAVKKLGFEKVS